MEPAASPDFRLGILQCDRVIINLRVNHGDYPEMFKNLFGRVAPHLTYRYYDLTELQIPESLDECDAWLFTGSKWSVYQDELWIHKAHDLALQLHHGKYPLIGICFGHQLIAEALGGKVAKSEKGWGVGIHQAEVLETCDWMSPPLTELRLIVSHQDQVVELPEQARRIAGHDFCPNDILQIGETTLTFQGHPEFTKDYAREMLVRRQKILKPGEYKKGIETLQGPINETEAAMWIVAFIRQAMKRSPGEH